MVVRKYLQTGEGPVLSPQRPTVPANQDATTGSLGPCAVGAEQNPGQLKNAHPARRRRKQKPVRNGRGALSFGFLPTLELPRSPSLWWMGRGILQCQSRYHPNTSKRTTLDYAYSAAPSRPRRRSSRAAAPLLSVVIRTATV